MIPRPLDPLRSIKLKLGVLVVISNCATALVLKEALEAGVRGRYALPVAVLAALAVTQVLAHGMTSPLREMTAIARDMARGRYGRQARAGSRDEVGELARTFNAMAAELAETDRRRREFIANVSHELRTPIAALQAQLENMADGVTTADEHTLHGAVAQTERLSRLIGQLLDLSQVDGGEPLHRTEFPVAPFLAAVVEPIRAAHPQIRCAVRCAGDLTVHADRDRLHQVVVNLVENAARYGGTTVTLTASRTDGEGAGWDGGVELTVTDDGPGIPAGERTRVFERFTRGSPAADGGTGLGLAIARWAVDLHGGTIEVVDSPAGCRIRVVLPG